MESARAATIGWPNRRSEVDIGSIVRSALRSDATRRALTSAVVATGDGFRERLRRAGEQARQSAVDRGLDERLGNMGLPTTALTGVPRSLEDIQDELDGLVGLASVKEQVRTQIAFLQIQAQRQHHGLAEVPTSRSAVAGSWPSARQPSSTPRWNAQPRAPPAPSAIPKRMPARVRAKFAGAAGWHLGAPGGRDTLQR